VTQGFTSAIRSSILTFVGFASFSFSFGKVFSRAPLAAVKQPVPFQLAP